VGEEAERCALAAAAASVSSTLAERPCVARRAVVLLSRARLPPRSSLSASGGPTRDPTSDAVPLPCRSASSLNG
jgi:hypothetical protein